MTTLEIDKPFNGKTVVITGAGTGLGRAMALGFSLDGAHVIAFGRTLETLQATQRLDKTGRIHCIQGDVASQADVERLFEEAASEFSPVDILVNNAAVYPKKNFLEVKISEWARAFEINTMGVARCCRAALPGMLERNYGRIINVGSRACVAPIPSSSAYSSSKAAVNSLTKAIAADIDRAKYPNVLINELLPGIFRTSMSESGSDPDTVYPYAKRLAAFPAGGATGRMFLKDELFIEDYSLKARIRRKINRLLGKPPNEL